MTSAIDRPSKPRTWVALPILGLALAILLADAQVAFAHANLVRAVPSPNAVLDTPPTRVQVWFSEPLAPAFSEIQVLDSAGRPMDQGDSIVDPLDPTLMSVSAKPLPRGLYTVAWKNVSTVDGHSLAGSYVFSVGEPIVAGSSRPQTTQPLLRHPLEPVVRWLVLVGATSLLGGVAFDLAVAGPLLAGAGRSHLLQQTAETLAARRRRLLWLGLTMFILASVVQLVLQAASASGVPWYKAAGNPVASLLGSTQWGHLWLWRMAAALALAGLLRWCYGMQKAEGPARRPSALPGLLALATASGLLLTLSLVSHGAALPQIKAQAVASDYLHLLGVGLWLGGLLHFATTIPLVTRGLPPEERCSLLSSMAPRFTAMAALSIGAIVVSGAYGAWAQVMVLPALATPYGVVLLAKVGLVALMLLLGAANLIWTRPRLRHGEKGVQWLGRLTTAEAALGLLVLASVGLLTSLEPARQAAAARGAGTAALTFHASAEGLHMTTTIEPGGIGQNRVRVSLMDTRGRPVENALAVEVRLTNLVADLGEMTGTAQPAGGGEYLWDGPLLSVSGIWQGEVVVRRADAFDARSTFRFELSQTGPGDGLAPKARTGQLLLAVELGLIGVLFLVVGFSAGGIATGSGLAILTAGALVGIVGFGVGASLTSSVSIATRNPFPPDLASLALGGRVYSDRCQTCHGLTGRGDGPGAASLPTKPFDLAIHVPMHADSDLFTVVSEGRLATSMPSFKEVLSRDEIWHVINYIRAFRE
ncbi:MAG: copper resistance protein CopC [Chloroflexi bacterium]|nr:copper resistance protein CopC [Chloroflexota bacterium]